jgi:hypothetical protein
MTVHQRHPYCKEVFQKSVVTQNGISDSSPLSSMGSSETTVSSDKEKIKMLEHKLAEMEARQD